MSQVPSHFGWIPTMSSIYCIRCLAWSSGIGPLRCNSVARLNSCGASFGSFPWLTQQIFTISSSVIGLNLHYFSLTTLGTYSKFSFSLWRFESFPVHRTQSISICNCATTELGTELNWQLNCAKAPLCTTL